MSNRNRLVQIVKQPLSEIVRIYSEETTDPAMKVALVMLSEDIKKLENELREIPNKLTDELWKDEK